MKISYLCVTHERPQFIPWLLWNFERQTWPDKELIIVDSSETPAAVFAREHPDVRVVAAPGANVPAKRNIALAEAAGDAITWLDDDDWRHPDSAAVLAALLDGAPVAGGRWSWFVDLATGQTRRFCDRRGLLFACLLLDTSVARAAAFDERLERGSDLPWLTAVLQQPFAYTYDPLAFFLSHDRNLGNGTAGHTFNRGLDDISYTVGRRAWGKTTGALTALRGRLRGD